MAHESVHSPPQNRSLRLSSSDSDILLNIKGVTTRFHTEEGVVQAVNGVDLQVKRGKTIGIVGESGCGKTVLARTIMRLLQEPPARVTGQILWNSRDSGTVDLAAFPGNARELRSIRGKEIGMIFQEPMTSLSPVHTIGNQICESLMVHQDLDRRQAREQVVDMLRSVGIPNPEKRIDSYPFELSGGLRQRAMIALAMICHPDLLIADEPTTALDVTVQAGILNLMKSLQSQFGMSILFITHDLGVIARMAEDVVVMYLGKVVEQGSVYNIFENPQHPYTQALLRSMPVLGEKKNKLESIEGSVPSAYDLPKGCSFFTRCREARAGLCDQSDSSLKEVEEGHWVRCLVRSE